MEFQYRYDREEGNTMFDSDSSSFFLGDDASFQKKEAELAKRLVCLKCLNTFCIFPCLCVAIFFSSQSKNVNCLRLLIISYIMYVMDAKCLLTFNLFNVPIVRLKFTIIFSCRQLGFGKFTKILQLQELLRFCQ